MLGTPLRAVVPLAAAAAAVLIGARPAAAIPVFAHRYGLTCQACHTEVPHLTPFGERFLAAGYRLPGVAERPAFPVAIKAQAAYSSAPPDPAGPLPRTIVDEVELLAGGHLGRRTSYFTETYAVDGGFPGRPRDVWIAQRLGAGDARVPVSLRAGQFTLDLPVEPETFRETTDHYAIFDPLVSANPFSLFAPKLGLRFAAGSEAGTSGSVALLQGHEAGSGLPARGLDRALFVQQGLGALTLSAYRYDGTRPLDAGDDRFWRQGYGVEYRRAATTIDAVLQTGRDTSAGAEGNAVVSSGGFVQLRRELGGRAFAVARWDAAQGDVAVHSVIAGLGYRPARNIRITAFDTLARRAGGGVNQTLSGALLVAY